MFKFRWIEAENSFPSYGVHYLEIIFCSMNLDELLTFKPQKKRSLAEDDVREDEKAPSSKRRGILAGNGSVSRNSGGVNRSADRDAPLLPLAGLGGGGGGGTGGELNGVSEEEKLRILQSLEDDEDDTG